MNSSRFQLAVQKIDEANSADPNREVFEGKEYPKELLYSIRMSRWVEKIAPEAGEALKLAARGQHLCRWEVPRSGYSMDRAGYLKWRTYLYTYHADKTAAILKDCGYGTEVVERVRTLIQKKNIKTDPEMQTLEDVICLVFLENYFAEFSVKHDEEKMIVIIQKTWKKMSETGHRAALNIPVDDASKALLQKALKPEIR